ncbi:unnamed protein product [Gadus morhua 'NCC']
MKRGGPPELWTDWVSSGERKDSRGRLAPLMRRTAPFGPRLAGRVVGLRLSGPVLSLRLASPRLASPRPASPRPAGLRLASPVLVPRPCPRLVSPVLGPRLVAPVSAPRSRMLVRIPVL